MTHRVIIVGAGIIGSAIAYYLSKEGADVTIIEQHRPACGATSKSFGWINANFSENPDYFRLRERSIVEYQKLSTALDKPIGLKWGGSLWWECKDRELDQHMLNLKNFGYPVKEILSDEFNQLEPAVLNAPKRCAKFPTEGAVDPIACAKSMINAAKSNGATLLIGCEASNIIVNKNRCIGVSTTFGDFIADTIVVAVGASAKTFLGKSGITLPMHNPMGLIVHTQPVDPILNHLMITPGIHFRQHTNGSIVLGEDFSGGTIEGDPIVFSEALIKRLGKFLPNASELNIHEITVGKRPIPSDGYPVLGPINDLQNLYIASMHSGVTLAPIVGKITANEILSGQSDDLLKSFRASRFS